MRNTGSTGRAVQRLLFAGGICAAISVSSGVLADVRKGDQNGVAYENGGWSGESQASIRNSASTFPLLLVFALRNGDYLADVAVRVENSGGESVFSLSDAGPFVLVGLPVGAYTVKVERAGRAHSRRVNVGVRTHEKAVFHWAKE